MMFQLVLTDKLRQHLVAVAEDDHVVPDQVVGLQHVTVLRKDLELSLGRLSVVDPEVVAGLQVDDCGTTVSPLA